MKTKEPTNGELSIILDNLVSSVNKLHDKVDYTNGNVRVLLEYKAGTEKDVAKIDGLEKDIEQAKGTIGFLKWVGLSGLVGILASLVNTMK